MPPQLRADVLAPDLPSDNTVGVWIVFGDGAVGKISEGNDKKNTILWIFEHCEAEALAAAKEIDRRPIWERWFRPLKPG